MSNPSDYSPSGAPILRHTDPEREWQPATYLEDEWLEAVERHAYRYLGESQTVFHELLSDTVHIDVHIIAPTTERNYYTLYTTGMSALPMNTPEDAEDYEYAELMISLPPDWPLFEEKLQESEYFWPIEWLKRLARLPHDYNTWLSWGHTIPNGDPAIPLADHTDMCAFMVLPPIEVDEDFLTLEISDGKMVHFYAILPIYLEELEYKLEYGLDPLLDKFEEHDVNEVFEPNRINTCKDIS